MANGLVAVRSLHFLLLGDWNRRDAHGMASLYSPNGGPLGFKRSPDTTAGDTIFKSRFISETRRPKPA